MNIYAKQERTKTFWNSKKSRKASLSDDNNCFAILEILFPSYSHSCSFHAQKFDLFQKCLQVIVNTVNGKDGKKEREKLKVTQQAPSTWSETFVVVEKKRKAKILFSSRPLRQSRRNSLTIFPISFSSFSAVNHV